VLEDDVLKEMEPFLTDEHLPDLHSQWKTSNLTTLDENSLLPPPMVPPLNRLKSCITESMRLDPPGSLMNNIVTRDFIVKVGQKEYKIYKGTRILPCVHTIHRSSLYWHCNNEKQQECDGWEYKPQRFINGNEKIEESTQEEIQLDSTLEQQSREEGEKINPFTHFFPFGKSDRKCPGAVAGLLMARTFVAMTLWYNRQGKMRVDENLLLDSKVHFNLQSSAGFFIQCS